MRQLPFSLVCLLLLACPPAEPDEQRDAGVDAGALVDAGTQDDAGMDAGTEPLLPSFKVGSYNLEFLGDPLNGPNDEKRQVSNVAQVLRTADADIWGLQEIVSPASLEQLQALLPGHQVLLVTDHLVHDGATTWGGDPGLNKMAVLYRSDRIKVLSARVIHEVDPGRPPLEVSFLATVEGHTHHFVMIVVHLYPFALESSWVRRKASADALKAYLDANHAETKVFVVGDWNDDVDESIVDAGMPSPFQQLVADPSRYRFPTSELSAKGAGTTVSYSSTIDHHLVTNELGALYRVGSARVERADAYVPSYRQTTSDHYPVVTHYAPPPAPASPGLVLTSPNGGERVDGFDTLRVTWWSSGVAEVHLDYSLDGGGTWTRLASNVAADTESWCWRVPNQSTSNARVRVVDASAPSLVDGSNGTVRIVSRADTPAVLINEVLPVTDGPATEFVELVNLASKRVDLGRWTLDDTVGTVHRFDCGVRLEPGKALVVFGGASAIPLGERQHVASSSQNLYLDPVDELRLRITPSTTVDTASWTSAADAGVSVNRKPDGTAGAPWAPHTDLSGLPSSPGKRANGSPF